MTAHNDKLLILLMIVIFPPQCVCVVVFQPPEQQQQDVFVIFDNFAARGTNSGYGLESVIVPLSIILPLMVLMGMMRPSTTTSISKVYLFPTTEASSTTQASLTTQASSTTNTPCVLTNCPPGYMMLTDENGGTSCYLYSGGNTKKSWDEAMRSCAMTPGAFLWNPNSETEANAVHSEFNLGESSWFGGRRDSDGKYIFAIDNLGFVLDQQNIPFGAILLTPPDPNAECLGGGYKVILPGFTWFWVVFRCTVQLPYTCEFPRKICPHI